MRANILRIFFAPLCPRGATEVSRIIDAHVLGSENGQPNLGHYFIRCSLPLFAAQLYRFGLWIHACGPAERIGCRSNFRFKYGYFKYNSSAFHEEGSLFRSELTRAALGLSWVWRMPTSAGLLKYTASLIGVL